MSAGTGEATAPPADTEEARRGAWGTTWLLLTFMLVNFADKTVMGLAADPIREELGLTRGEFGTAQAAFFALFSLAALGVSFLTRHVRTTVLLLGMALLWSAAQLPMLLGAAGFGTLLATRVLLGAAEGPAAPVAVHHLHGWFGQRERTLPTAVLMVGAAGGVAVSAPLLTVVIDVWGWRWAFGSVGLVGLVWAMCWNARGEEGPLAPLGRRSASSAGSDSSDAESAGSGCADAGSAACDGSSPSVPYRRLLLSGTWLTAALGAFAAYWLLSAGLTWAPDYLHEVSGLSLKQSGAVVTATAVGNAVVLLTHGLLARRASSKGTAPRLPAGLGGGLVMCVAAMSIAAFAEVDAVAVKIALMVGPMALTNVILTVAQTAVARITPAGQRGVALGALAFVYALAGVLSPLVTGRMVDAAASVPAGYHSAYLVMAGLVAVAGVLAVCFLRPEKDAVRLDVPETPAVGLPAH
ncbi:MFS transporter [Streptomyces sp. NBC_00378]|uniref:MFS transporter n=1 Tax=unclassified Streptomyces TaxID=2593676 RepID=UPI002250AB62|nr:MULTISPECIES: MFS transporter [unclassified Streptomyces]MCX5112293.1 MFS transporter [Streptomyces sp. NBC_00378]